MYSRQLLIGVVLASVFSVASAQTPSHAHAHGGAAKSRASAGADTRQHASDTPATTAYRRSASEMHKGMDFDYTNDADIDVMKGILAYHQGAIAMAKIGLERGRDPLVHKLSKDIIAAQAD